MPADLRGCWRGSVEYHICILDYTYGNMAPGGGDSVARMSPRSDPVYVYDEIRVLLRSGTPLWTTECLSQPVCPDKPLIDTRKGISHRARPLTNSETSANVDEIIPFCKNTRPFGRGM